MKQTLSASQASSLLKTVNRRPTRVSALLTTDGDIKGSYFALNLASMLSQSNRSTLLLDLETSEADLGHWLNDNRRFELTDLMQDHCSIEDIIIELTPTLKVIRLSTGSWSSHQMSSIEYHGLIKKISASGLVVDELLVHAHYRLNNIKTVQFLRPIENIMMMVRHNQEVMLQCFSAVKKITGLSPRHRFWLISQTETEYAGQQIYNRFKQIAKRFLAFDAKYLGHIPNDSCIQLALDDQEMLQDGFPGAKSTAALQALAKTVNTFKPSPGIRGFDGYLNAVFGESKIKAGMAN